VLRGDHVVFVYLAGTRERIAERMAARHGHFMSVAMLDSQLETLEAPTPDESAIAIDITGSAAEEAEKIIDRLHLLDDAESTEEKE
jgi:gluconokinase